MFNFRVCRQYDLGAVPLSIYAWPANEISLYAGWPSQIQPCTCLSDDANYTSSDGNTTYFRDFVGGNTTSLLQTEIMEKSKYAGGTTGTCYWYYEGTRDCEDFPELCHTPSNGGGGGGKGGSA